MGGGRQRGCEYVTKQDICSISQPPLMISSILTLDSHRLSSRVTWTGITKRATQMLLFTPMGQRISRAKGQPVSEWRRRQGAGV